MADPPPVLGVSDLQVSFTVRTGRRRQRTELRAVDGVSLEVTGGETVAIVGESGSGKSTLARAVLRQVPIHAGVIRLNGTDITRMSQRQVRPLRRQIQMVFQDPYSSLDPSMVISEIIAEPLQVHTDLDRRARHQRVGELLELVGLSRSLGERYPYEFSGGQRQRLAIARAIALGPRIIVCDEAVSALDVSTQNQIINLLEDLQNELGVAYLFISHDLAVVRHIAQRVAVMYLGRIVETGPVERVFLAPQHPYTQTLLDAIPVPDPRQQRAGRRDETKGDVPHPGGEAAGCPFSPRCPHAMSICTHQMPPSFPVEGGGAAACWLVDPVSREQAEKLHERTGSGSAGSSGSTTEAVSAP